MADKSKIEWTDATWNPIRGCSRVSEGCRNCYAERVAARFSGPGQPYAGLAILQREPGEDLPGVPHWTGEVRIVGEALDQPLHWKRPRKIFVNSMSDLFHEKLPDAQIAGIFSVMAQCEQHTFQILTKRAARMAALMQRLWGGSGRLDVGPMHNVWLGVSVEDQKTADERIPELLMTPAAVRWVSYEPALGPVDFKSHFVGHCVEHDFPSGFCVNRSHAGVRNLDWIVAGGESGPGARPAHPDWFRVTRDQCRAAGVPFFFKQWGEWLHVSQVPAVFTDAEMENKTFRAWPAKQGTTGRFLRVGKKVAGHLLDGAAHLEFPKVAQ